MVLSWRFYDNNTPFHYKLKNLFNFRTQFNLNNFLFKFMLNVSSLLQKKNFTLESFFYQYLLVFSDLFKPLIGFEIRFQKAEVKVVHRALQKNQIQNFMTDTGNPSEEYFLRGSNELPSLSNSSHRQQYNPKIIVIEVNRHSFKSLPLLRLKNPNKKLMTQ